MFTTIFALVVVSLVADSAWSFGEWMGEIVCKVLRI